MSSFDIGPGAMGTMLYAAGLPIGDAPERWNLERAGEIRRIHRLYVGFGATWCVTNTFGAARPRLALAGLDGRLAEVNRAAVRCARAAAEERPLLASLGPTWCHDPAAWTGLYMEQVGALAEAGVDGYLVETVVRLAEGVAAVQAAALASRPIWACFTPGPDGCLPDGTTPEAAAEAFVSAGASVVGVNCGTGPASLLEPARRLVAAQQAPVGAAPSAGLPTRVDGRAVYALSPEEFALAAVQFREIGVRFFAGCCGTTPQHVRAAVAVIRSLNGR